MEAIVAVYSDWGIGAAGTQPLTVKADRRRFRALTEGAAVIVGRKTLADFPGGRPLKNRVNLVLSRRETEIPGAVLVPGPAEAAAAAEGYSRALVIGGASVYRALFPQLHRVYVTKLEAAPPSDVFFPDLDADPGWRCTDPGEPMEEEGITYRFTVYERVPAGEHLLHLNPGPFARIQAGEKRIELRLNDEKRRAIRVGDLLRFQNTEAPAAELRAVVTALHPYPSFRELYRALPLTACGYREAELAEASPADMERYYSPEEERRLGVLGIGFRLLSPGNDLEIPRS